MYASLGMVPTFIDAYVKSVGLQVYYITVVTILCVVALLILYFSRSTLAAANPKQRYGLLILVLVLAGAVYYPESAATRFHVVMYGVLGWLILISLGGVSSTRKIYFAALCISMFAGMVDELLQWYLPNRFGLIEDVVLNWVSSLLSLLLIYNFYGGKKSAAKIEEN